MAICKMQRMNIVGLRENRKQILERLQAHGVMEINIPPVDESLKKTDTLSARTHYERQIQVLTQALDVLDRFAPEKKSLLSGLAGKALISEREYAEVCARSAAILDAAGDVLQEERQAAECHAAVLRLTAQADALIPWLPLSVPMSFSGTRETRLLIGSVQGCRTQEELLAGVQNAAPELAALPLIEILGQTKDYTYLTALCHRDDAAMTEEAMRSIGFARPSQITDTVPAEAQARLQDEIRQQEEQAAAHEEKLRQLGAFRSDFRVLSDYYRIRAEKYEVLGRLPQSEHTFVISGYVPEADAKRVADDLTERCGAYVEIEALPEEEEAPVLLRNGRFASMTESVVHSFGLPAKGEIDPTFFTTLFYIFFFGLMLSDAGYGLIVSLACGFALLKFPRMEEGLQRSLRLFFWCGVSTVFWGVMFGGYFGDAVETVSRSFFGREITVTPLWFAPIKDPTKMLIFSMLFGLIHLFTGLAIKGYVFLRDHDWIGFIFGVVCWFFILIGLIIILLPTELFASISGMTFRFPPLLVEIGKYLAIAGAVGVLLMSARDKKNPFLRIALGAYDLYGITSWLSDVLSYSRLLALGLATGVIAQVINQMGSMLTGSVIGDVLFVIIFLLGHTLNLGINLLGAYVHTCRLQYVEFYGKFYEGGGRDFTPFQQHTTYVDIKEEL